MSFKIFSDFETTVKRKFKRNNELINITVAKFLNKSFNTISKVKNSKLFAEFHTKSSRSNYIASEIVLQYLEKRGMRITIQCANKETHSKYFRKHSDKWLQRELQLKAHLDLFAILISDRKKEMISISVLKSQYRNHNIPNGKSKNFNQHNHSSVKERSSNNFSSSSITPSPTPSPKKARIGEFPISSKLNKNQWPISLSSSSSQDSQNSSSLASPESKKSPKSKKTKILNITEISADNQFYYQKKVVNEVYDIDQIDKSNSNDINYSSESLSKSENDKNSRNRAKSQSKKANDFDSETGSENDPSKDKYSVSEILKYRTVSTTDKSRVPRFQQLKKKTPNIETINKNPTSNINNNPAGKERQVTFVDQNQNQIQIAPKLSSFKPDPSSSNKPLKGSFASDFPTKSNLKPSSSSVVNSPKTVPHSTNNESGESNSPIQFQFETINKPTNNQESVDDDQNHRKSRENRRRVRLSKNMPPKQKPIDDGDEYDVEFLREVMNEKTRSGRREKYEKYKEKNLLNQNENKNDKIFCKESTYEKDWDRIAYSESSSEFEQQKSDSKFIKNDNESKDFNLSLEDNCFYFEKEPTESNIDIGTEVNLNNLSEQQKEITEIKPNYYTFSMKICSAKKVIKTDLIATCDPYCKFIIKNEDYQTNLYNQTKIVHDTQNPEWNEEFTFNIKNVEKSSISFLIFDYDLNGSDKMLNSIVLPLSKFVDSINGVNEWLKLKSEIPVGTITDLHVIVKARPEFGSLKNVDFGRVIKDSADNDYESDQISPLKIKKEESQTEIRNFDKNESDKNEEENQTENKNKEEEEENESQTEIRNINNEEEEEKSQIKNKKNEEEEESQTKIRGIYDDDEKKNKEEEDNQDDIKNADNNNNDDDDEESQTEIKFDSLFENESKIEPNLPNSSKNEIKNSSFGLVQTEEEEEESQPEINNSNLLTQNEEEEESQPDEFISSNKLNNDDEKESQKDLQLNSNKEIGFGNENFINEEEEDLSLSEGNINDNEFEFEIEEEDEIEANKNNNEIDNKSEEEEGSTNKLSINSDFDHENENEDNIISIDVDVDI